MASLPPGKLHPVSPVTPLPAPGSRFPRVPLPVPLTALVGRGREVAQVHALLRQDDVRLVTLVGPGGVGKTRLALRVAEGLESRFRDGVVFVSLGQVRDSGQVIPAIARELEVREAAGERLEDLVAIALSGRQLLLVLDNLEQVLDAAPGLAELLLACPALKILTTSRELLHVSGEQTFPVPPLSLAEPRASLPAARTGQPGSMVDLAASEAVRLFVTRAQAVRPDFVLDDGNVAIVAEICRRVDCLPLGIELAAARLRHLPLASLLGQLDRRLPLLTGGPRDLPARLRTMSGAIAWSYDLLDADEQALFRRLAVFAGGCTLGAAERVAQLRTEDCVRTTPRSQSSVLDAVASLLDKNLLRREDRPNGDPRFGMLETIREYALEQLTDRGEEEAARMAHAAWCLAFAERAEPELTGSARTHWLDRQDAEMANMRAALRWLSETERVEPALRLAGALVRFWEVHGHWDEGRQWLEDLLMRTTGRAGAVAPRAKGFSGLGMLAARLRDFERAVDSYEQSLALSRAVGDKAGVAFALDNLGYLADDGGDRHRAETLLAESLALYRDLGDERGVAKVLDTLGLVALMHGDRQRAGALLEDSLARSRAAGEQWLMAITLTNLGVLANHQRDYARARGYFEEGLALCRAIGSNWLIPLELAYLGLIAQEYGHAARAAGLFAESLALCRDRGAQLPAPRCLEGLAAIAVTRGHFERAARLFGAAQGMRSAIRGPMLPADRAIYEPIIADVRRKLGEAAFAAGWAAGQALPVEPAIAEAMTVAAAAVATHEPSGVYSRAEFCGLSPRETDVLRLLAAGRSDREIAVALFISHRTVHHHVANVFAKLGVHTRAAAAGVALGADLLDDGAALPT